MLNQNSAISEVAADWQETMVIYYFLLATCNNHASILHRFGDTTISLVQVTPSYPVEQSCNWLATIKIVAYKLFPISFFVAIFQATGS